MESLNSSSSQFSSFDSFERARMNSCLNNMLQFDGNSDADDEMASEQKRLETYKGWPESSPMKPIDLAQAGFYYTGFGDKVRCFSCDLQLTQWKEGDNPFQEHKKIKKDCKFVLENERDGLGITCYPEPASGEPVTGSTTTTLQENARNAIFTHRNLYETPHYSYQSINRDPNVETGYSGFSNQQIHEQYQHQPQRPSTLPLFQSSIPYSNNQHITSYPGVFITSQYPQSNRPLLQTPEDFAASPSMVATNSEVPRQSSMTQTHTVGQQCSNQQQSIALPFNLYAVRNRDIPVRSPVLQHVPNVHIRPEDTRHTVSQTDLQSDNHRLSTFIDWPDDCPVRPCELAPAGFFYKGTGDMVMCYKCKVALQNWEPDDTPWDEHKRWSPDCPLVKEHDQGRHIRTPVEDQETTAEIKQQQLQRQQHRMQANIPAMPRQEHYQPSVPSMNLQQQQQQTQHHNLSQRANTVPRLPIENQPHYNYCWGKAETVQHRQPPSFTSQNNESHASGPVHDTFGTVGSTAVTHIPTSKSYQHSSMQRVSLHPSSISENVMPYTYSGNQSAMYQNAETQNVFNQRFAIQSAMDQNNATQSGPIPSGVNETAIHCSSEVQHLSDRDLAVVIEMGFTREAIDNAIARHTERTGQRFTNLDDLMQSLLDEGLTSSRSSPPLTSANQSQANLQTSGSHGTSSSAELIAPQLSNTQSFSFEHTSNTSKRALKRSNSAPPGASARSNPSEHAPRELENTQEERLTCKICMDAEVGVVFIPCGHISCCPHCASGLDLCPICRKPIQKLVRTFLS